jgi:hypothetical protein
VPVTGTSAQLFKRARARRGIAPSVSTNLEDGAKPAAAQRLRERQVAHGPGRILAAAVAPNDVPLKDLAGLGGLAMSDSPGECSLEIAGGRSRLYT